MYYNDKFSVEIGNTQEFIKILCSLLYLQKTPGTYIHLIFDQDNKNFRYASCLIKEYSLIVDKVIDLYNPQILAEPTFYLLFSYNNIKKFFLSARERISIKDWLHEILSIRDICEDDLKQLVGNKDF